MKIFRIIESFIRFRGSRLEKISMLAKVITFLLLLTKYYVLQIRTLMQTQKESSKGHLKRILRNLFQNVTFSRFPYFAIGIKEIRVDCRQMG